MEEKPLGWRPGPASDADWPLRASVERKMAEPRSIEYGSKFWYAPTTLRQWTGSCVGHGAIQLYNASPKVHRLTDNDAMLAYDIAQRKYDPWPETPPEEGTSVRAGAMAMRELGYWQSFAMAYNWGDKAISPVELVRYILNNGPIMLGIRWLEGYDRPRKEDGYVLKMEGQERGGHNIVFDGASFRGNPQRDWVRVHQSWGEPWGYRAYGHGGFARVPWPLFEAIVREEDTTACSPVEA